VQDHPASDAAAEAQYKVGLDLLFRERRLEEAVVHFEAAARRPQPFWSAAARTSLGLCYFHQQKLQKALFELRKVAYAKAPNVHSITALAFIENIFSVQKQPEEASRVRKDRIVQLEQMVSHTKLTDGQLAERAYFLYQLAVALADQPDAGSRSRSVQLLQEAKDLGKAAVGDELYQSIETALSPP
jgi:tetratricopeptide (TPR) repeat protein